LLTACAGGSAPDADYYNTKKALIGHTACPEPAPLTSSYAAADYSTKRALLSGPSWSGSGSAASTAAYSGDAYNTKLALRGARAEATTVAPLK
jgi:hypothetical protein